MAKPAEGPFSRLMKLSMQMKTKMDVHKRLESLFQQALKDMESFAKKGDTVNSDKNLDLALQYSEDMKQNSVELNELLKGKTVR